MQPYEIVIVVLAVLLVLFTIVYAIFRKKKGKPSCQAGCSGCPNASFCNPVKKARTQETRVKK